MAPEVVVYRTVGGCSLDAHVYAPSGGGRHPAIVLFHGGNFEAGGPGEFKPHCEYLSGRGMVAVDASYRLFVERRRRSAVLKRTITQRHVAQRMEDCIDDAAAAVAWARRHPGVDARRVVAAGFSAGGYLAACTGLLATVDASSRPDALVLLNAPLGLGGGHAHLSPSMHVRSGAPPTLILSGSRDWFVSGARSFKKAMAAAGNRCELVEFDGAHTVFRARKGDQAFLAALARIDAFLVSLGLLNHASDVPARIDALELPPPPKPRATLNREPPDVSRPSASSREGLSTWPRHV